MSVLTNQALKWLIKFNTKEIELRSLVLKGKTVKIWYRNKPPIIIAKGKFLVYWLEVSINSTIRMFKAWWQIGIVQ